MARIDDVLKVGNYAAMTQALPEGPRFTATLTADEMASVGAAHGGSVNNWGEKLIPLLVAKGIPAECLHTGAPCRMDRDLDSGAITFQFPNHLQSEE